MNTLVQFICTQNFLMESGDAKKIAETADEVGLDYIILTDHNTLRAYMKVMKNGMEIL